jgi:transcriptional regulator with XRE-family HTH domain
MAYSNPQQGSAADAARLRKEAGAYLKSLREAAELTQRDVAMAVGFEYYTMVSQIENGKTRLPPAHLKDYAKALKVDPVTMTKRLLSYYDPLTFDVLFGKN